MAIFDTMELIKPDVSTICVGMAASMGAFLLACGQKGKRFALPNSRVMIHQPSGGFQGTASDIEITAKEILKIREKLNMILAEKTGQKLIKSQVIATGTTGWTQPRLKPTELSTKLLRNLNNYT